MIRLLIATGGTGGHVFPAVALADNLRQRYPSADILFAGTLGSRMQEAVKSRGYDVKTVAGSPMPYGFNILILPFIIKALSSFIRALGIIREWRPQALLSMGSFSGGPFVLAAKMSGVPVLVHEQNLVPGRANYISAFFADRVAVSFSDSVDFFPGFLREKIVYTGNPVRKEILNFEKAGAALGLQPGKFTVLVMGGSQGSHAINKIFAEAARGLDKNRFQILHLSGNDDFQWLSQIYKRAGIANRVFPFLDKMGQAYGSCDLVIARSGAITLSEITAASLACVLIPYPYGDAHQRENAKVITGSEAGLVIEQKDLTAERLLNTIKDLSQDEAKLNRMRINSRGLARPDAAERLTEEIARLTGEREIS